MVPRLPPHSVAAEHPGLSGQMVTFEALQRLSGYERRADVERWATAIGLVTARCRGGVWTTLDAMNQALGVRTAAPSPLYEGDVV